VIFWKRLLLKKWWQGVLHEKWSVIDVVDILLPELLWEEGCYEKVKGLFG